MPALRIRAGGRAAAERPSQRHLPRARPQPGERAQELALAVAVDAGEADDLARAATLERDVVEAVAAEAVDLEQRRRRLGAGVALGGEDLLDRAADDQPRISPSEIAGGLEGAAGLAVAQDGDAVGDPPAPRGGGGRCRRPPCPARGSRGCARTAARSRRG